MACGFFSICCNRPRLLLLVFVLLALVGRPLAANASPTIGSIRVGVAGVYRTDRWCPIELLIAGVVTDGDYRIEVDAVNDAGQRIRYLADHRLKAQAESRIVELIQLGRSNEPIRVAVRSTDGELIVTREFARTEFSAPLADNESLTLVIGRLSGLNAVDSSSANTSTRNRYHQIADFSLLPASVELSLADRGLLLDAATTIVWMAGQSTNSQSSSDRETLRSLDDWVRGGGRLIISLGPDAAQQLADSNLSRGHGLGTLDERVDLLQPAPLEAFISITATVRAENRREPGADRPFQLPITRLESIDGKVAAAVQQQGVNLPLVIEVPHGFGQVTVVAFDLNDAALLAWSGHSRLVAKILSLGETESAHDVVSNDGNSAWAGKGYTSLSEQLADALDQFPGTSPERFWFLAAALIGYVLVIGPIDWYLVRRKPEWTWATFLATVVLAAGGAYAVVHFTKADEVLASGLSLVDVDLTESSARVRGTTWASIYQPTAGDVDVAMSATQFGKPADSASLHLSLWNRSAATGDSLTSLISAEHDSVTASYDARSGRIRGLSLPAWSSQLLKATWHGETSPQEVASLSPDAFGRVIGSVRNPLEEPLEQCVLFYGNFALTLGDLKPSQETHVDGRADWRSTQAYLTRQTFVQDQETAEKYDPTSVDLGRIGEIIGFYAAAGGERYAGLDNRDVAAADLSNQLRLGRAILIGQAKTSPEVELSSDNAAKPNRQATWWRFLIRPTATASGK